MATLGTTAGVDELLDQAGDAVARNDWELAKRLAQSRPPADPSASGSRARSAEPSNAYLETERTPERSALQQPRSPVHVDHVLRRRGLDSAGPRARRCAVAQHARTVQTSLRPGRSPVRRVHPRSQRRRAVDPVRVPARPRGRRAESGAGGAGHRRRDPIVLGAPASGSTVSPSTRRVGIHTGRALIRERSSQRQRVGRRSRRLAVGSSAKRRTSRNASRRRPSRTPCG